ncbi:MAG: ATP-binding protein [Myxococcota bacterium]
MTEVSGRAVWFLFEVARQAGVSADRLVEGLDVQPVHLSRRPKSMAWSTFVELSDRFSREIGGPAALREIGRRNADSESFRIFNLVGRAVSHPIDLYYVGVRWMGPSLFPMMCAELEELPGGRIRETITIPPEERDCPALFHVFHGAFQSMPKGWGHGESEVELELRPRHAVYTIRPHTTSRGRLGRFVRGVRRKLAFRPLLDEIGEQQQAIHESFWDLREAHEQIRDQAEDLRRINAIGRELARHIDLDRVSDILVSTLIDDLDADGVELWLVPPESDSADDARLYRSSGATAGAPTDTFSLGTAGRDVGTLHVWRRPERARPPFVPAADQASRDSVLERLVPWIAMALDNARTYGALRRHASELEERVRERTASLTSANHHLTREIEERKRATEALFESEAQLRASERLAAVGTLAAGIAHEINNPVGSILAAAQFAQVVERDGDAGAQVQDSLADIVREAKRCGAIVKSVLQFARDETTDKWACRLDDLLRRTVDLAQPLLEDAEAEIHLHLPDSPVWVRVNPIQIEQALLDLVRNALEAGSANVHLRLDALDAERRALVQVDDDGPGIPEAERVRIFEPFYTTRRDQGGRGLGLSVVHGIASEHLGQLKVENRASGGVAALFELPSIPSPAVAFAEKRAAPDRPSGSGASDPPDGTPSSA